MRGRFFVIEGIDGSGKSTLAAKLAEALALHGRRALRTREPGGTPLSEKVRHILLDARNAGITPLAELFLYMASRAQLVEKVIRPALKHGVDVVCDRYYYSTAAYQGAAGGVGPAHVLDIAERIARFEKPDLVLLLDLHPKVARARKGKAPLDRVELKGQDYQRRVRKGFLALARRDPKRFRIIDADCPMGEVFQQIWKAVARAL
jgi:dTMP kinase